MHGFEQRSHKCAEIGTGDVGKTVTLYGWVHRVRDLGGVIFVHLRDISGVCQVVCDGNDSPEMVKRANELRSEFVMKVKGTVRIRPEGTANLLLTTGSVEVVATSLEILNMSEPLPFLINDDAPVSDVLRLKYRYLDLRKPENQKKLIFRSKFVSAARRYMESQGFLEIETPILTKSTPEGARDFLVPSRLAPHSFYALPQSPQLFKQILMVAGFDRYFQVCRCFRDEDLRADRQPEFTQLDIETSFLSPDDLFDIMEGFFETIGKELGFVAKRPFPRMTYAEAMRRYGSDKPDIRFGLELCEVSDLVKESGFKVFTGAVDAGGQVSCLVVPKGGEFSRSEIDAVVERAKELGAKGLVWARIGADGKINSSTGKHVSDEIYNRVADRAGAKPADLMLFVADKMKVVAATLGALRLEMGKRLNLIPAQERAFLWVTEFPWLEYDEQEKRYMAMHHPFTKPVLSDLEAHQDDPGKIRAQAYDLVLNGSEIGGGSVRIHRTDLQERMFEFLKISKDEGRSKFGFLLDALAFGAPPHAGMALGVDRITAILQQENSLREVIPFPKTQKGQCLMTECPSEVTAGQLNELSLRLKE